MTRRLLFTAMLLPIFLHAQPTAPPREWILGLHADATKYFGDFTDNRFSSGGALSLSRYLRPLGSSGALYGRIFLGAYDLQWLATRDMFPVFDSLQSKAGDKNRCFVAPIGVQGLYRLLVGPKAELFLGLGLEVTYFSPQDPNGAGLARPQERYGKWTAGIPISAEFECMLSENLALNFHAMLHAVFTDYLDGFSGGNAGDMYMTMGLGLSYSFPAPDGDADFDGLSDRQEREITHTDPYNRDTDGDGLSDKEELVLGTDPLNPDSDGDGLSDGDEVKVYHTNPLNPDTDGDGLPDGEEVFKYHTDPTKFDTDGDGLSDYEELFRYHTDPLKQDSDGDGLSDGEEVLKYHTDPLKVDTDGDGLSDYEEVKVYHTDPLKVDTDGDGLTDGDEVHRYHTDPLKVDTDGGGVGDGVEVRRGTNPLNPRDDQPAPGLKLIPGKTMVLDGVAFDRDGARLAPSSDSTLARLVRSLMENTQLTLEIAGYTDDRGTVLKNDVLSQRRADAVKAWLIAHGVGSSRLSSTGMGARDPVASNASAAGRAKNNRIELHMK